MANQLGIEIIQLGKEIVFENITIGIELSETDPKTGCKQISTCGDCQWDKCVLLTGATTLSPAVQS
jgi:hypothetical protein